MASRRRAAVKASCEAQTMAVEAAELSTWNFALGTRATTTTATSLSPALDALERHSAELAYLWAHRSTALNWANFSAR